MSRAPFLAAMTLAFVPVTAGAQALSCAVPATLPPIHPELPSARDPQRLLPIGGYTLAMTWVPEYCHGHGRDPAAQFECGGSGARFGFALHGLWPDGVGPVWPQYCKSTPLLPSATLKRNLCSTPSAQLLQHEWAKHGTCTGMTPDAYFARSTGLFRRLHFPDMAELSRDRTSAGAVAQAVAAANPGVSTEMMRVTASRDGWLDEIWFCLDRAMVFTRCRAGTGGVAPETSIRVARLRETAATEDRGGDYRSRRARRYGSGGYDGGRYGSDRY